MTRCLLPLLAAALIATPGRPAPAASARPGAINPPAAKPTAKPKPQPQPWTVADAGPHHRTWQSVEVVQDDTGQWLERPHTFVELATGMHRRDPTTGRWMPAEARWEPTKQGYFVARQSRHQVIAAPNLNVRAAVDLLTPDGQRLRSSILGLALLDTATGHSVMLAEPKDCQGVLTSPTDLFYADAFDGIRADVLLTLSLAGFEQNVLLREQPSPQLFADERLDPDTTRMMVLTEFVDPPVPTKQRGVLRSIRNARKGLPPPGQSSPLAAGTTPDPGDLIDEVLAFGEMTMGSGRAFRLGAEGAPQDPTDREQPPVAAYVGKSWENLGGRQCLIESVNFSDLLPLIDLLPQRHGRARTPSTPDPPRPTDPRAPERYASTPASSSLLAHLPLPPPRPIHTAAPDGSVGRPDTDLPEHPATFEERLARLTPALSPAAASTAGSALSTRRSDAPAAPAPPPPPAALLLAATPAVVLDYPLVSSTSGMTFRGDTTYKVSGTVYLSGTTTFEGGTVIKFDPGSTPRLHIQGPIVCRTDQYRPATFTARDDDTIGEIMTDSLHTPQPATYYGNPALSLTPGYYGTYNLSNLRFRYHALALSVAYNYYGYQDLLSHLQFLGCQTACSAYGANLALRNALFVNSGTVLNASGGAAVQGQHWTVHNANTLHSSGASTLTLANSLLVGIATQGPYSADSCATAASADGLFLRVGAAGYYLPGGSPHRNAGTATIDATLAKDLRKRTTSPPVQVTGPLQADTTWAPQASRDLDLPDRGYHYDPLDYVLTELALSQATLTLTNAGGTGVAVGVYGANGLLLQAGAKLRSEGTPLALNRLVRYQLVQEQSTADWAGVAPTALVRDDPSASGTLADARCRFTEFVVPSAGGATFTGGSRIAVLALTDCQLLGGAVQHHSPGATTRYLALTNSVFERLRLTAGTGADATLIAYARNCLFWACPSVNLNAAPGNAWRWYDNAFDTSPVWTYYGAVPNGYNASINCNLVANGTGNFTLASFAYASSTLGRWYHGATTLENRGSRLARDAGLYHHTTKVPQTKEGDTQVDIGFHYIASTGGVPADTDGDGLADYLEDRNGNAVRDPGETDFASADTDYDGCPDAQELAAGTDPLNAESFTPTRLGWWRFNRANWAGEQGQLPLQSYGIQAAASWSGSALKVPGSGTANLKYRDTETTGAANINCRQGTVRFWFSPTWNSGTGPGSWARLIEMGAYTADGGYGLWGLFLNPQGTLLQFHTQGGGTGAALAAPVNWAGGTWHQVVLTYSSTGTALYVDGALLGTGSGVSRYPSAVVRSAKGLNVGGSSVGTELSSGQFDELETFNYRLDAEAIAAGYQAYITPDKPQVLLDSDCVSGTQAPLTVSVPGGGTAQMAILVDSEDFDNALWGVFVPNPVVNLGAPNARHAIWVGVRGIESPHSIWDYCEIQSDTVAPNILSLEPPNGATLTRCCLFLQGWVSEVPAALTLHAWRSPAEDAPASGCITDYGHDASDPSRETARFAFPTVELADGWNYLLLEVADCAGNTTRLPLSYYCDPSLDTTPPSITVDWPQDGASLGASTVLLRGRVSEPCVVSASVMIDGNFTERYATLNEQGCFLVSGIPLPKGSTTITIRATDDAGNAAQTTVSVIRHNTFSLSIDPVSLAVGASTVSLSGQVGDSAARVEVNGLPATVATSGAWQIAGLPVGAAEVFVATVSARGGATLPSRSVVETAVGVALAPRPWLKGYTLTYTRQFTPANSCPQGDKVMLVYAATRDGRFTATETHDSCGNRTISQWSEDGTLRVTTAGAPPQEYRPTDSAYRRLQVKFEQCVAGGRTPSYRWTRTASARALTYTGNRLGDARADWPICRTAWFVQRHDPAPFDYMPGPYDMPSGTDVPLGRIQIAGKKVDCNATVFASLPARSDASIDVTVSGSRWYSFTPLATWPRYVPLTAARHPECAERNLQPVATDASLRLGIDNDGPLCDTSFYNQQDDVPYYVDFHVINSDRKSLSVFPAALSGSQYNDIRSEEVAGQINEMVAADIKRVSRMEWPDENTGVMLSVAGYAGYGVMRALSANQFVIANSGRSGGVFAHEWMHTYHCVHRINAGDVNHRAVMHEAWGGKMNELARDEVRKLP